MFHVVPLVTNQWYELGLALLGPKYENSLENIEEETGNTKCCRKMFNKWLKTDQQASWNRLIKALGDIELNYAAIKIMQLLQPGEWVVT